MASMIIRLVRAHDPNTPIKPTNKNKIAKAKSVNERNRLLRAYKRVYIEIPQPLHRRHVLHRL